MTHSDRFNIRIIIELGGVQYYEIICENNSQFTINDLKQCAFELWNLQHGNLSLTYTCDGVDFRSTCIFFNMKDYDLIPINSTNNYVPYYINEKRDLRFNTICKDKHKVWFGNKQYPCPYMNRYDPKTLQCPYVSGIKSIIADENNSEILHHLSHFNHFEAFNILQPSCKDKDRCKCYLNILFNNYDDHDKKHLYMYHHPTHNERLLPIIRQVNNNGKNMPYEYFQREVSFEILESLMQKNMPFDLDTMDSAQAIIILIAEVIRNGFEKDLVQRGNNKNSKNINFDFKFFFNDHLNLIMSNTSLANKLLEKLKSKYEIFDKLDIALKHPRHNLMNYPLSPPNMLSLLLYCGGECNYDLSKTQRNGSFMKKWPYYDKFLNNAIDKLSKLEKHRENIYHGICGVLLKCKNDASDIINSNNSNTSSVDDCDTEGRRYIVFKTNASFTTDLQVAKDFRGSDGIIIGLNMKRSIRVRLGKFVGCDVSWISKFPNEREILVKRGSTLNIYNDKMTLIDNNKQFFVCDEGNQRETSFQTMFPCAPQFETETDD